MKRVWQHAAVTPQPGGFGVALDGKMLRLPTGPALLVPYAPLAEAVAAEWQQAGAATGSMTYDDVPLTRLAGTAQLRIVPDPAPSAAAVAAYGETDLLCYRDPGPGSLRVRQDAAWQPWLDWARVKLGAALAVTGGIVHVRQHPAALAALRAAVNALDPWVLGGLGILVPGLGSLVLGLAVAHQAMAVEQAHDLSRLDEIAQAELWGEDAEAAARTRHVAADLAHAARYMALLR